ncbi:MAG: non-canonical purine NTP diphosphatase [Prevotellaceae bacterium]|nr:non-canonical purine NTP diphosphatase [Prevotellaceae bacterium]
MQPQLPTFARNFWQEARDYVFITFALIIYATGLTCFLLPYEITTGGFTGVASIIYYITHFEVQNTYLLINIIFLVAAVIELGWKFCIKTIYAVLMLSFILWAMQRIIEMQPGVEPGHLPKVLSDRTLSCIIGGIFEGVALAMCFLNNGSTGGTDIIAAIVNKYKNLSLGNVILICDIIVISSSYFVFRDEADSLQRVILGYITLSISSVTLDYVMNRRRQSVQFMIFSRNYSKIADAINATGRGVTVIDGTGWYTKTERKVLVCLAKRSESINIFRMIKSIDPYAFMSMGNVLGVYGEGFDKIKAKSNSDKRTIVFATNNAHKLEEVRQILGDQFEVRSLDDIGCHRDIPETGSTFRENALQKAQFVKTYYGFDCFADDSGLECDALGGAPGVLSARYADGKGHDNEANMRKLLDALNGNENRKADFRTVIAFVTDDSVHYFEGTVDGKILAERRGEGGFGYDPLFLPDGYDQTFAEMSAEQKNGISHRAQAVAKFAAFLTKKN